MICSDSLPCLLVFESCSKEVDIQFSAHDAFMKGRY